MVAAMIKLVMALVALGGCMRIYADPELPDIELAMNADCESGSEILINLVAVDEGTVTPHVLPCSDEQLFTLEDVARKLFRVDGAVLDADGNILATASSEVDLRNGFDEEAYLYFDSPRLRVGWDFDMGATCASLEIDTVAVDFRYQDEGFGGYAVTQELSCDFGVYIGYPFGQMVTIQMRGISRRTTVAASPRTPDISLAEFGAELTDVGTLTLAPCGTNCPSGPQSF